MQLFAMLSEVCLLAERQSVLDGAMSGAVRGAIIGGIVGGIVGIGAWAMKKLKKDSPEKSPDDQPPMGG